MNNCLRLFVVVSVIVLATAAFAEQSINSTKVVATPIPIGLGSGGPSQVGAASGAACLSAYDALLPTGSSFLALNAAAPAGGMYVEYADDCHLSVGGLLCEFSFTYFKPDAGMTNMVVTLYANDAADGVLGAVVAGPYLITALPSGLVTVTVPIVSGPIIPADVWFSVTSTSTLTHGLVIAGGPPVAGSSHDLFLHVPSLGLVWFGGSPAANFNIAMTVDATVPTETTTWGTIKSIYSE